MENITSLEANRGCSASYSLDNLTTEQRRYLKGFLALAVDDFPQCSDLPAAMAWHNLNDPKALYDFLSGAKDIPAMICAASLRQVTRLPDDKQLNPRPYDAAPVKNPRTPGEAARNKAPRASASDSGDVLSSLAPNPKRAGSASAARYSLYQLGMTRLQLIAAGLSSADIRWDMDHGYIQFSAPISEAELSDTILEMGEQMDYLASQSEDSATEPESQKEETE